ncbi:hypothetical protein N5C79_22565 [Pantoea brenneri]|uniref:hypothetical protein n=1 Tax=Pantoea brenneri TaxID=472694 RepID=UPI002446834C|nr:hypothetical protein [Pantoea brenneri]MDH1089276.1 hypothetical protein [Pantoea brenneri]
MKIGIYCTVSIKEFSVAMATLRFAELSDIVHCIVILITDISFSKPRKTSKKITVYSMNLGSGYDVSVRNGGYDQISARNFLIDRLSDTEADWIMLHDADDIYHLDYYLYVSETFMNTDAITCSCFSVNPGFNLCSPPSKTKQVDGKILYNPHTRIWRKDKDLRYEKTAGIEYYFTNHTRHCGVIFPKSMNISIADGLYHFHLHALLNKRHSSKILNYPALKLNIPREVKNHLEINKEVFSY